MKVSCIIIEDEPFAQKLLQSYIERIPYLTLASTFTNPVKAYPFLQQQSIDLIFLDIEMPELNGMQFLAGLTYQPQIIFTTAYSQYAVESYEKNALDYLLKPITFERFLASVNKHPLLNTAATIPPASLPLATETNQADHIFVKVNRHILKLFYQDIFYIEALRDYVLFHTASSQHIVYHSLKKLEEFLPTQFQRVHHSYIVNLNQLEQIRDNHICMGDKKIPISKKYRDLVLAEIQKKLI